MSVKKVSISYVLIKLDYLLIAYIALHINSSVPFVLTAQNAGDSDTMKQF